MAAPRDADVIIAGGGPAGLMLANELGRRGIAALLLCDRPSTTNFPQANATQARSMEHYRRLGFADAVRAVGMPADYPTDVAYFTRITKHELARFALPAAREARQLIKTLSGSWSAAELPHRGSQLYVERVLRAEAEKLPAVRLRFGWRVERFVEEEGGVAVDAVRVDDGATQRFTAAYLAGCDGARSAIRKQLGFHFRGEAGIVRDYMGGRMLSIWFRAPELYRLIPFPRAWQYWAVNRTQRGLIVAIDGREEFVFMFQLPPGMDEAAISDDWARAALDEAVGAPVALTMIGRLPWTAGLALVAEKFQRGRVFLAGDAVHLFTPTGGLGYNTAIEDAVNLGWKLAAVLTGWGGARLLDSYERERLPVAARNTGYARYYANSIGNFTAAPEIEDATPAGEAARRDAGLYLNRHVREEFNIPGITFGARYDGSPIIVGDGQAPPPDRANDYVPSAVPCGRAPHAWLGDGRSLYDTLGFEFTLLRLGSRPPDAAPFARAAASRGLPLAIVDRPEPELRDLYAAGLALIRPDQIVAWRGDRVPEDVDKLLALVTGA
ncbi:MAG TPA: FAD-dependent oxidoreductase [Stellaceae bacterium]|jgi:2-polyprenyl-6-methoxyphenol hydroxylase-like FAD-dependent oxidoreductase|nr:FAD-dependent oxidoreductase [Stellaceae bacterium]